MPLSKLIGKNLKKNMPQNNTEYVKSCGVIIFHIPKNSKNKNDYEFLLLHYESGHWDYVKGHVEKNETEIETALRELDEETSLKDVKVIKGYKEDLSYIFSHNKQLINKTVVYFLAESKENNIKISDEHIDYIWLPYKEALEKLTFQNAKNLLKKAFSFID